jgi:hypothetical protein
MSRHKAKIPIYVDRYDDLQWITRDHTAYLSQDAGGAWLRFCGENGGQVWGQPGHIIGGVCGPAWAVPAGAVSNDPIRSQHDLDRSITGLRRFSSNRKTWTAGSAALSFVQHHEGAHWGSGLDVPSPTLAALADSIHGGPCEWRRRVYQMPLIYIDQRNAYLRAMEAGVPDWQWRQHDPRDWEGYVMHWDDPWCTVSDVTIDLPAELAPRRTGLVGPICYETGRQRLILRGPILRLAIANGAEVIEYHGGMHAKRHHWRHAVRAWRHMLSPDAPKLARGASKAMYSRIWGKYASCDRMSGRVYPQRGDISGDNLITIERDDTGRAWYVAWDSDPDPACYRPDIAGEITAWAHARTLDLAYRCERAGLPVALTHVDAVCIVAEDADRLYHPEHWAVKARGVGSVLGHGRYYIDDPERGPVMGRMGLGPEDGWIWASPMATDQIRHSVRSWTGDTSAPRDGTGQRSYQSAPYPWS